MDDELNIDFKKILEEDKKFAAFLKDVVYESFIVFNPQLMPIVWSLYQSEVPMMAASFIVKNMIRHGGPPPNGNIRRNS